MQENPHFLMHLQRSESSLKINFLRLSERVSERYGSKRSEKMNERKSVKKSFLMTQQDLSETFHRILQQLFLPHSKILQNQISFFMSLMQVIHGVKRKLILSMKPFLESVQFSKKFMSSINLIEFLYQRLRFYERGINHFHQYLFPLVQTFDQRSLRK